jgi:hypothetical protein
LQPTKPPCLDAQTPCLRLERRRQRAPFKLGRGGTPDRAKRKQAPHTDWGLDPEEPHSLGPSLKDPSSPCPTVSLPPGRAYPNLPPRASPSWRSTNGAPLPHGGPRKGWDCPERRLNRKVQRSPSKRCARPTRRTKDSEICSDPHSSIFPRTIQIRRGQPVRRLEVFELRRVRAVFPGTCSFFPVMSEVD